MSSSAAPRVNQKEVDELFGKEPPTFCTMGGSTLYLTEEELEEAAGIKRREANIHVCQIGDVLYAFEEWIPDNAELNDENKNCCFNDEWFLAVQVTPIKEDGILSHAWWTQYECYSTEQLGMLADYLLLQVNGATLRSN